MILLWCILYIDGFRSLRPDIFKKSWLFFCMDVSQTCQYKFNIASLYQREIRNGLGFFFDPTLGPESISRQGSLDIYKLLQFLVGISEHIITR